MTQHTALFDEHVKLKGNIVNFAGWMLPVQYNSIKDEVFAVRNNCGVFDVSHMGEFLVEGPDAKNFVDQLVCNDIAQAPIGKAVYSPLLNDQGFCLDDLIVYLLSEQKILLCVNAANTDKDWQWVQKIHQRLKLRVQLTNVSSNFSLLALQGPNAEKVLASVLQVSLSPLEYYAVKTHQHQQHEIYIARTGYTGEDGFELFIPHALSPILWQAFLKLNVVPCGLGARDCLRVEAGYPLFGHEISEELTPLDAGLKWTVKLQKENFIGKSALINYQPRFRQIKFFASKGIPRENYLLKNAAGEILGKVTSGTLSPTLNRGIGLGQIKITTDLKQEILLEIRNQSSPIELTNAAFVKGGHK